MHAQCSELAAPKMKESNQGDIANNVRLRTAVSATELPSRPRRSAEVATPIAKGDARCSHCGLLVPAERRSSPFCCTGCEAVAGLLQQEGLTRFYDLGGRATGAVGTVPRVQPLDWLAETEARATHGDTVRLVLDVQGLRCAACVWLLQTVWQRQAGAIDLRIAPSLGQATLTARAGSGAVQSFLTIAARLGYPMAPLSR